MSTDLVEQLTTLSVKDDKDYIIHEFMGGTITQRVSDGYFLATQICKIGGKLFADWSRLSSTKEFLKILDLELNKDLTEKIILVYSKKGGNSAKFVQGSWIHPRAVTNLVSWISPKFAVNVSLWIEEWKLIGKNKDIYMNELCILESSKSNNQEKIIQLKLSKELNAKMEIETPVGYIDLLSTELIIEIKEFSLWKQALGQVLSYGIFHPLKNKVIYLFGDIKKDKIELITEVYSIYDVKLEIFT